MGIRLLLHRVLILTLSVLYLGSASPAAFAAIDLDQGHSHRTKFSFNDGHFDIVFSHEGHPSDEHNHPHEETGPRDSENEPAHIIHLQEYQSIFSAAQSYSAPELILVNNSLSKLVQVLLPENSSLQIERYILRPSGPEWVKLRTVMLI
jgi:hypothetical protein